MFSQKNIRSERIWGSEKFGLKKYYVQIGLKILSGPKINLYPKKHGVKKIQVLTNLLFTKIGSKIIWGPKVLLVQKDVGLKNVVIKKNFVVQKLFVVQNILGWKTFGVSKLRSSNTFGI